MREKELYLACMDSRDCSISPLVDSVVQITIELSNKVNTFAIYIEIWKKTHKNDFVVENHRSIPSSSVGYWIKVCARWGKHLLIFEDSRDIGVSSSNVILACSQMTVDEANRRIVNHKTCNNTTLQ